ncbi:MAG: hypothetical protein IPL77_11345 [Flavobacteriales bacterium]|nr:hypothetical protein [Flavobacteriales bacterium]
MLGIFAWSLTRNVRAADKTQEETNARASALETRVRILETETIQALRLDVDTKLDGIKTILAAMASDLAVLKDREQNARAADRQQTRRRRS